jgi:hypothetical protein
MCLWITTFDVKISASKFSCIIHASYAHTQCFYSVNTDACRIEIGSKQFVIKNNWSSLCPCLAGLRSLLTWHRFYWLKVLWWGSAGEQENKFDFPLPPYYAHLVPPFRSHGPEVLSRRVGVWHWYFLSHSWGHGLVPVPKHSSWAFFHEAVRDVNSITK